MSDIVSQDDIQKYVKASIPEHLDVFRTFFARYIDAALNHSGITDALGVAANFYSQFDPSRLFPLLMPTRKLAAYSHYDIRNLVAMSSTDLGPSFFEAYFAHFFDRYELFIMDRLENRYENIAQVLYTDEGGTTDAGQFTDSGVGKGVSAYGAYAIFTLKELATVKAEWTDTVRLLMLLKPGRLMVYHYPALDIRINEIDATDPEYDSSLLALVTPTKLYDSAKKNKLMTDVIPPWQTSGDAATAVKTDKFSTLDYLKALAHINVRYLGDTTDTTIAGAVRVTDCGTHLFYIGEFSLTRDFLTVTLAGANDFFKVVFDSSPFIKGFNPSGSMNFRFSMKVSKGIDFSS